MTEASNSQYTNRAGRVRQLRNDSATVAAMLSGKNFTPGDQVQVTADPTPSNNATYELRALPSNDIDNWAKLGSGTGGGSFTPSAGDYDTSMIDMGAQIAPITASDLQDFLEQFLALTPLLVNGKLPTDVIPDELLTGLGYKGLWDASTNTPTLASGVGTAGDFYIVNTAGTTSIDGIASWDVGDLLFFSAGGTWEKYTPSNPQNVNSVFGLTGVVKLGDLTASTIDNTSVLLFSKGGIEYKITFANFKTALGTVLLSASAADIKNVAAAAELGVSVTAAPADHKHALVIGDFTAKTAPLDADSVVVADSAAAGAAKKATLLQLFTNRTATNTKLDGYVEKVGSRVDATGAVAIGAPLTDAKNTYYYRLTGNTTFTLPAIADIVQNAGYVGTIVVLVKQDATGSRTATFTPPGGSTIAWAGGSYQQPAAAANASTQYVFSIVHGETEFRASRIAFA